MTLKILFVCTGNICRSPTAHAIAKDEVKKLRLEDKIEVDSAGIIGFHEGEAPDHRSILVGNNKGISFSGIKSRQIKDADFAKFDLILAMDRTHQNSLLKQCPKEYQSKIHLFLEFSNISNIKDVKDPYYGSLKDFEEVFDLISNGVKGIINKVVPNNPA